MRRTTSTRTTTRSSVRATRSCVDCSSPLGGGIAADPTYGGPAVYLHVKATYIGPDSGQAESLRPLARGQRRDRAHRLAVHDQLQLRQRRRRLDDHPVRHRPDRRRHSARPVHGRPERRALHERVHDRVLLHRPRRSGRGVARSRAGRARVGRTSSAPASRRRTATFSSSTTSRAAARSPARSRTTGCRRSTPRSRPRTTTSTSTT